MANCNLVGKWATSENFYDLQEKGLIIWGGLTAAAWQYIGSQGVIQGTCEIFQSIARIHFGGDLRGRFILTAGLGGMGGAQPLAGTMANAVILCVEVSEERIDKRIANGYLKQKTKDLDEALEWVTEAIHDGRSLSIGLLGNAAEVYPELVSKGIIPDIVTDQTSAHDLLYGYVPKGYTLAQVVEVRQKLQPNYKMMPGLRLLKRFVLCLLSRNGVQSSLIMGITYVRRLLNMEWKMPLRLIFSRSIP